MNQDEIFRLLEKYRKKSCTSEEKELIDRWYDQFDGEEDRIPEVPAHKLNGIWKKIVAGAGFRRRRLVALFGSIAASVAVVAGVSAAIFLWDVNEAPRLLAENEVSLSDKVVLEVEGGKCFSLETDTVIQEDEFVLANNTVSSGLDYSSARPGNRKPVYNTIRVPRGGDYKVVLEDGTVVFMNSCSSLTYPVPFTGNARQVRLKGEAFFSVSKNGKPFVVKTDHIHVTVLGTSFNVSDYEDDGKVTTTLVSGRVAVSDVRNRKRLDITPGHTFIYDTQTGDRSIDKGNGKLYLAWREGVFRFKNMRLEDIFMKLERWYDLDVEYKEENLKDMVFTGAVDKDRPVGYLLGMIETVTDVRFKVEGRKIRVGRD